MGEAPAVVVDNLLSGNGFSNGFSLKSRDPETTIVIGDKTYVIAATGESIVVKIYDKSTGSWVIPTVRGIEPSLIEGHSAVFLNEERILVIKKGSSPGDCLWFLEVDTSYVRAQKKVMGAEVVAWSKGVIGNLEIPIVISGPSGVGKGTLISMLMKEFPSMFGFSVSHTTRPPRTMEKDGVHYHFTKRSVMEEEIKDGKFLEFASVHGNLYGTSVESVKAVTDAGKRCVLDIDVQGARSVSACPLDAIFIFICPPSMEDLEERLCARGTETEEQIRKRLRNAKEEIEQGKSSGIFDHILYNGNLEECYKNLKKLLALDDGSIAANYETSPKGINLPAEQSVSKVDNTIIINCGNAEGTESKNIIVSDVSLLKGGAPGGTRGLRVYAVDSFLDGLNGGSIIS